MKLLFLLGLVVAITAVPLDSRTKNVSDSFQAVLEKLRNLMRNGSEEGFPVLDPWQMDTFEFAFEAGSMLSANIYATGIELNGLSDFIANTVRVQLLPLGMQFDFDMPFVKLTAEYYKMRGMVFNALPIYGEGKAHFEVTNLNIKGFSGIRVGISGISLRDLKLELNLEKLRSETTGMLGGGDIDDVINAIIEDLAAEFFNTFSDAIAEKVQDFVLPLINQYLDGMTLQDLLDLINGSSKSIRLSDLKRI